MFNVMKHKVTFHDVDATPEPPSENISENTGPETNDDGDDSTTSNADVAAAAKQDSDSDAKNNGEEETAAAAAANNKAEKKVRVRAVTELERVVFLSRERILLLACPAGPTKPGLVKSNHHLTELQKMTFMRRDPTLVTLHYLAPERLLEGEAGAGAGAGEGGVGPVAEAAVATKRNVYRFGLDDKEAFIRIIRGALQRFQA